MGQGGRQIGGSMMMMPSARAGVGEKAKAEAKAKRVTIVTIRCFIGIILH
jgi:hypothetical protein